MAFFILFLIPAIIAIGAFLLFKKEITLKEFMLHIAVQGVIAGLSAYTIYNMNTLDTEILNGQVTHKEKNKVSCSHSYSCNCRQECSGSGKDRSCSTVCDTCYEHSYDIDWDVHSNIGGTSINRVDRQGLNAPPRWTAVKIGEPFSKSSYYQNYIKASPDTLFRHQGLIEKYKAKLPTYPSEIYDYYKIDRTVVVGGSVSDRPQWDKDLSELNKIGVQKEVNMLVVLVFNESPEYFYALEQSWIGGKKNDAVLVIGLNSQQEIQWVNTMAWSKKELFKISLRNRILETKILDRQKTMDIFKDETLKNYERRSMKDFEYLKASITPSTSQWAWTMVIGIIVSILMSWFLYRHDIFDEEWNNRRYGRF